MNPAPSWQDLVDLAQAEMQSLRTLPDGSPALTFDEGDISEMIAAASGAVGDRIIGYLAERFRATFVDGASGDDLTNLADDHWSIQRVAATKAIGAVQMTRSTGPLAAGTVYAGTIIATLKAADGSEVQVRTDVDSSWLLSETGTKAVNVTAVNAGRSGNVAAGTLTRIIDTLFDSTFTVTNAAKLAGGAEEESDDSLRERIRQYSTTLRRATLAAIEYGAKQVPGVVNATAVEDASGIVTCYITDIDGGCNASLVALTLAELRNWRAAGIIVNVVGGALYTLTPINITLTVRLGVDTAAIATAVKTAIVARLDKLRIGEICSRDLIKQAALNVNDSILGVTVNLPAADVAPSAFQVIRTTTGDITVA